VWVSVAEAAEKSGVGTSTVRQWYRSGRIPTQRAEGDRGAFLVPLDAVVALANQADEEGDDLGAAVIDLNASYWSAQTEAAREEAAEARQELAAAKADLADAEAELDEFEAQLDKVRSERDEAVEQLGFLRAQLAEASGDRRELSESTSALTAERDRYEVDNRNLRNELSDVRAELGRANDELSSLRGRIAVLDEELTTLRAVTAKAGSITDNSWLDQPTNSYRSPVRPQGMAAAEALSGLLASTTPDTTARPAPTPAGGTDLGGDERDDDEPPARRNVPAKTMFDDVDRRKAAASRPRMVDPDPAEVVEDEPEAVDEASLDDEAWAAERRAAALEFGFGEHDDDLLPEPEKKGRRGRK
jgi:hypothetical protein